MSIVENPRFEGYEGDRTSEI